jgi:rubrerythrin
MVEIVRQAVIWFVSALVASTGARCGRYLAERLTEAKKSDALPADEGRSRVLCRGCGRPMRQQVKELHCPHCGHREG